MENFINGIKDLRVLIDASFIPIASLNKTRETSLALTKAQESKMWLGQILKELGNDTPYTDSKNPKNDKIEPTADVSENEKEFREKSEYWGLGDIEKVKFLRNHFTELSDEIHAFGTAYASSQQGQMQRKMNSVLDYTNYSYKYCLESNMWLGMELGRIYESNK